MGGGSGGGGRSGRGGGGKSGPTDYTVTKAEYLPGVFEGGSEKRGIELIQVKSGEWTYTEGRTLTHYQAQIKQGKMNINPNNPGGGFSDQRYHASRDSALKEARMLNSMTLREKRAWEDKNK